MDVKKPEVSLKRRYRSLVEIGLIITLAMHITLGIVYPRFRVKRVRLVPPKIEINIDKINVTHQVELPPPPARPSVPIESESEDILDDVTIDPTTIDEFEVIEPPPPPDPAGGIAFIAYDEGPEPIGGFEGIRRRAKYPEIAQEAGIEGQVVIHAFINEKGIVTDMRVLKGIPNTGLNEAALKAVGETRFKPAKQRDRPVAVWMAIPITFKLQ